VTEAFIEGWTNDQFAWKTIFALPPERRAQLAERLEAQPSPPWAPRDALRAVLAGPQEVLKWLAAPSTEPENSLRYAVLWAFVDQPGAEAFKDRLAEMIKAPGVTEYVRSNLAGALVGREWVSREQIRAWAAHSDRALRSAVWSRFAYGKSEILTPAEAWPLVVQVAKGRSNADLTSEHHLGAAFVKAVEGAPWPEALDDAADLVAAFGPPSNPSARMVEALTRAVERAPDDDATNSRLGWWSNAVPGPEGFDQLVRWTRTLPTGRRRWHAFRMLVQNRVLPQQVPQVAALLTATDLPPEERRWRWDDFFATPRTASALTDRGLVLEFFDAVSALSPQSAGEARMKMAAALAGPYARGRVPLDTLMEAWLAHPERAPFELAYQHTDLRSAIERAGQMARWRAAWREAWNRWTPEQRVMGSAILDLLGLQTDAAMTEFLHQQLRARPVSVPPRARGVVIAWLDAVELADVQAVYDLTKSDDLKEVVKFVLPSGNQPPRLKPTLEVFQAMRAGLKSEMYDGVLTGMAAAFRHIPSIQRELATALLAHPERTVHGHALEILQERASPEDEDLWIRALGDPDKDVRARAAAGMDRVPTENVKRALVKALDDPHPDVRAAALTALDSIQKQEDLKARWRERVK
jgi:hypothetical protein